MGSYIISDVGVEDEKTFSEYFEGWGSNQTQENSKVYRVYTKGSGKELSTATLMLDTRVKVSPSNCVIFVGANARENCVDLTNKFNQPKHITQI